LIFPCSFFFVLFFDVRLILKRVANARLILIAESLIILTYLG